jgi:carboxypeptidase Q
VIDAVRVIESSGSVPRRTIRFVLFSDGRQRLTGTWAYTQTHAAELNGMVAAIIFEDGCGALNGYSLNGRKDIFTAVGKMLEPIRQLGAADLTLKAEKIAEHLDFLLEGIPTLVAVQPAAGTTQNSTRNARAFDIAALKHNVAVASVSIYALADDEARVGARQTRSQVAELLKETGLEQQMKDAELWPAWKQGKRGER